MSRVRFDCCRGVVGVVLRVALLGLMTASCTTYEPVPVYRPSKFDQAWDAARGAAADVGVAVTSADRSRGVIRGTAGGSEVTITVWTQADASVRVEINVKPAAVGADPHLAERLSAAYDRRMGR